MYMKKKLPARSPHINYRYLYHRIKKYRGTMKQHELSEKLGYETASNYGKLERGDRPMSLSLLAEICVILHVPLEDMVKGCLIHDDWPENTIIEDDSAEIGIWFQEHLKGQSEKTVKLVQSLCLAVIQQNNPLASEK